MLSNIDFTELDQQFVSFISNNELAGCVLLIERGEEIIYDKQFGYSHIENKTKMNSNTLFRLQSMIKPLYALCILKLYEEGKLSLDTPLSKFHPSTQNLRIFTELKDGNPSYENSKNPITILDLLQQTSGVVYGLAEPDHFIHKQQSELMNEYLSNHMSVPDYVEKLLPIGLMYEPGTKWYYGPNFTILATIIEKITGLPYFDYLKQTILDPLDMKNTFNVISEEIEDRVASIYIQKDGNLIKNEPNEETFDIYATASDYLKFASMLSHKGRFRGKEIFKKSTIELFMRDHLEERGIPPAILKEFGSSFYDDYGFGLGVAVKKTDGIVPKGLNGWAGLYSTYYWVDPTNEIVGVFMAQSNFNTSIFNKFTNSVYKCIKSLN